MQFPYHKLTVKLLKTIAKLFAGDRSLFSVANNKDKSPNHLTNVFRTISRWAYKWKMLFNPDISKLAHEVVFSKNVMKLITQTYILIM